MNHSLLLQPLVMDDDTHTYTKHFKLIFNIEKYVISPCTPSLTPAYIGFSASNTTAICSTPDVQNPRCSEHPDWIKAWQNKVSFSSTFKGMQSSHTLPFESAHSFNCISCQRAWRCMTLDARPPLNCHRASTVRQYSCCAAYGLFYFFPFFFLFICASPSPFLSPPSLPPPPPPPTHPLPPTTAAATTHIVSTGYGGGGTVCAVRT